MTKILRPVLRFLDRIYDLDPGKGPVATDDLNVGAGIQLVHNVGRGADMGGAATAPAAGLGRGFFAFLLRNSHGGAGSITGSFGIAASLPRQNGWDVDLQDCWLLDVTGITSVANSVTRADLTLRGQQYGTGAQTALTTELLQSWNDDTGATDGFGIPLIGSTSVTPGFMHYKRPRMIHPTAVFLWTSTVTAISNVDVQPLLWVGPRGCLPPDVA